MKLGRKFTMLAAAGGLMFSGCWGNIWEAVLDSGLQTVVNYGWSLFLPINVNDISDGV
jgi:hypothetical protein